MSRPTTPPPGGAPPSTGDPTSSKTRGRNSSPSVRKKAQRRGSGTTSKTNRTNKSFKTNTTKSSNVTNKSKSSNATNKSKSSAVGNKSTASKKNPPLFPPKYSQPPMPVKKASPTPKLPPRPPHMQRPPQWSPSNTQAKKVPQINSTPMAPVAKITSPPPPFQARKTATITNSHNGSQTGHRASIDGQIATPNVNQDLFVTGEGPPRPPSLAILSVSPRGSQNFNKRNSHAGVAPTPKTMMRAPPRPGSMTFRNNTSAFQQSNQPLPPKQKVSIPACENPNRLQPKHKAASVGHTKAQVMATPEPRQAPRTRSLDAYDHSATQSENIGGSGGSGGKNNPFQGILARTRSAVEDLMGNGSTFEDEPLNDAYGDTRAMARVGSKRQQRRNCNQSDHNSIAVSTHHRRQPLPPPPNRATTLVAGLSGSIHAGSGHSVDFFNSGSTVFSRTIMEEPPFEDDPIWKRALRYVRVLPPSPKELPINRKIRIYIWISLVLDIVCAVVAISTFTQVTTCCGKPIWSMGGSTDWSTAMTVISYIYILGILVEILPVVRQSGIPWNMVNPLFGFMLTFAVFFDDSRIEAISIWILETTVVIFDFLVYRLKRRKRMDKEDLLDTINQKLEPFFASNRRARAAKSAEIDISFHEGDISEMEEETVADHREIKLLRDRRHLRQSLAEDQKHLTYHLAGAVVNSVLTFITLIFIIAIATTGGMCIRFGETPNPFSQNQLDLCSACQGTKGLCEICTGTTQQCYYPY